MTDFLMPALGADMDAGTLVEWLVKPGQQVKKGDIIAVVETQKGALDVECFTEGELQEIMVEPGKRVPVGTVLARIGAAGEPAAVPAAPPPAAAAPAPVAAAPPAVAAAPSPPSPPAAGRVRASLLVRREAAARGIDLAQLHGTGIDGAITLADLEAVAHGAAPPPAPQPSPPPPAPQPSPPPPAAAAAAPRPARGGFDPAEMRKAIAAAMSRSKREIPHYYLTATIDMARAMAWLEMHNAAVSPPQRLLPAVLLLKAGALALRAEPRLNGTFEDGAFRPAPGINPGWAIALRGGGLVAPAIADADRKSLDELMAAMRDLVARARSGGLRLSELTGGSITLTSLGDRGAEAVIGVIYPPQVALVGFGRLTHRPMALNAHVEVRPTVAVSLAADHRVTDGHLGGLYLAELDRLLQEPETL